MRALRRALGAAVIGALALAPVTMAADDSATSTGNFTVQDPSISITAPPTIDFFGPIVRGSTNLLQFVQGWAGDPNDPSSAAPVSVATGHVAGYTLTAARTPLGSDLHFGMCFFGGPAGVVAPTYDCPKGGDDVGQSPNASIVAVRDGSTAGDDFPLVFALAAGPSAPLGAGSVDVTFTAVTNLVPSIIDTRSRGG